MLLTTGIIALSRKVADEKAKKREAKQGQLKIGSSDVAKRAFESQTTKMLEAGDPSITRTGTDIKFEDPNDVQADSPVAETPTIYSPVPEKQDARQTSQVGLTSPVDSERGYVTSGTPTTPMDASVQNPYDTKSPGPPPYSPSMQSSAPPLSPSVYSRDPDNSTLSDTKSIASRSTNSKGTHAIRIKTRGEDLKSGFPYHPALFDLRVHPDRWDSFTSEIINRTKFSTGDYAKLWGAATATALTGAIATSVYVGRSMNRNLREDKVRAGLEDMSDGGLGDYLKMWNEEYFQQQGLFVHLELSESTVRNSGRSKLFRKPAAFYNTNEERERKRDERKFVIVVTKLDDEGQPTEALQEIAGSDAKPVEIGSSGEPGAVELPAEVHVPVELPAGSEYSMDKKAEDMSGYVEMDSDNSYLLEKIHLNEGAVELPAGGEQEMQPKPLVVVDGSNLESKEYRP